MAAEKSTSIATPVSADPHRGSTRRKALLQMAAGAAAAVAGAGMLRDGTPALAADLVLESSNATTLNTTLTSASNITTFRVGNTGGGASGIAIEANNSAVAPPPSGRIAIYGYDEAGQGNGGTAILGRTGGSTDGKGIWGLADANGSTAVGVVGEAWIGTGVVAFTRNGVGLVASTRDGVAARLGTEGPYSGRTLEVNGTPTQVSTAVITGGAPLALDLPDTTSGVGVQSAATTGTALKGTATGAGRAVHGIANAAGGVAGRFESTSGTALQVVGAASVSGTLTATSLAAPHNHSAANVTSGTLAAARIPALDASKTTTGTFTAARIPALDASKLTTGTLASARLPSDVVFGGELSAEAAARTSADATLRTNLAKLQAQFGGTGKGVVPKGKDRVTVLTPIVKRGVNVLVTLQSDPGKPIAVRNVVIRPGSLDVVLTGLAGRATKFTFFVFK